MITPHNKKGLLLNLLTMFANMVGTTFEHRGVKN